ncbi:MAG TPA: CHAD domain-containing protein [Nevskiaceae bacterium]|nr:CHAD domain-containing protein [Nevskiaceae bacterium]
MSAETKSILCTAVATRMLEEALQEARQCLKRQAVADEEVHAARKALKRARAALRLLRPSIGDAAYRRENTALRDAGQHLSAIRDAKANLDALDALLERNPDEKTDAAAVELRRTLEEDLLCARHALRRPSKALDEATALLDRRKRGLDGAAQPDDALALQAGLKKIYRKARVAMTEAREEATPEAFHEWRKQVKYLLNAVNGIQACLDPPSERVSRRAEKLADRLGDDHDLAVLAARIPPASAGSQTMARSIAKRRRRLRKDAVKLGEKLFDRKPARFVERLVGT